MNKQQKRQLLVRLAWWYSGILFGGSLVETGYTLPRIVLLFCSVIVLLSLLKIEKQGVTYSI